MMLYMTMICRQSCDLFCEEIIVLYTCVHYHCQFADDVLICIEIYATTGR
jgi:hypothetical protein